jgi:hypothetical protein
MFFIFLTVSVFGIGRAFRAALSVAPSPKLLRKGMMPYALLKKRFSDDLRAVLKPGGDLAFSCAVWHVCTRGMRGEKVQ